MFQQDTDYASICSPDRLHAAWSQVRANCGAGGSDKVSLYDFGRDLSQNLAELSRSLLDGTYRPLPVRYVQIQKANGKIRELGILTVRDRIAQRAVLNAYEFVFESEASESSYAFRPQRNVEMAIRKMLLMRAGGQIWTVESDIQNFFPSINRSRLLSELGTVISDPQTLELIHLWLDSGMLESTIRITEKRLSDIRSILADVIADEFDSRATHRASALQIDAIPYTEAEEFVDQDNTADHRTAARSLIKDALWLAYSHRATLARFIGAKILAGTGVVAAGIFIAPTIVNIVRRAVISNPGILQGSPLSPVLANFYMKEFDQSFDGLGETLVRYCDDFVILTKTRSEAQTALARAERILADRGLTLHPDKTRIIAPGEEFSFLGYHFLADGTIIQPDHVTAASARLVKDLAAKTAGKIKSVVKNADSVFAQKGFLNLFRTKVR